jgi:hypothetical protein
MKIRPLVLGIALAVLADGAPAAAQNLLTNPDFTSSLSGWSSIGTGTAIYSASIGSTALGAVTLSADVGQTATIAQCVAVSAASLYDLKHHSHYSGGGGPDSTTTVLVRFFSGAGCTGADLGTLGTNSNLAVSGINPTNWSSRELLSLAPPAGSVSARVEQSAEYGAVPVRRAVPLSPATVYGDHSFFGLAGTPVALQTFDVE